ncbi:MAG TPA: pilus assembly protein PilM [Candidatus Wallbacteria bacterium]|nr:pilus assembly protein PilM [Candidatus Wallbacteria bacterium]
MAEETAVKAVVNEIILGIDIGAATIKVAEGTVSGGIVSFSKVAVVNVFGAEASGNERTAELIRQLIADSGITSKKTVFVLNGSNVIVRQMDFPKMPVESLEKTIRFELKKEITYLIDDCFFDYKIIKEFDEKNESGISQKKIKVVVAAVETRHIYNFNEIARIAGLEVIGIAPAVLAVYSFAKRTGILSDLDSEQVAMFLDFGNSQMTVNFVSKSGLKFSKDINMGGSTLTTVIKTMYPGSQNMTLQEAEEKKFEIGIISQEEVDNLDDSLPNSNLHKVLNVSFKKLFQRVRLSTGYFSAHFQDSTVTTQSLKKIVLYGGNSEIPGVLEFFMDSYDASVAKAATWKVIENGSCSVSVCEKFNTSFLSLGAVFCEYFFPEYGINLLKRKEREKTVQPQAADVVTNYLSAKFPAFKKITKLGFLNSALLIVAVYSFVFSAILVKNFLTGYAYSSETAMLETKSNELGAAEAQAKRKKISDQYDNFQKKMRAKDFIEFKKNALDMVLIAVSDAIPQDANLASINYSYDDNAVLNFSGSTTVYDRVIKINETLKKNKKFKSVVVKKTEQNENHIEFEFECQLVIAGEDKEAVAE